MRPRPTSAPVFRAAALSLLAFLGLAAPARAQSQDPAPVVERAAARYAAAGTVCADFHQTLEVPLLDQRSEGRGRLCQRGASLFSMRFAEPAGDLVVIDGSSVWVYFPSRDPDQVMKAPMSAAGAGRGIDLHREFLEDAASKYSMTYEGAETVDGRRAHRIGLRPKTDARFEQATLWIDAGADVLRRIEITEENGSIRTLALSNVDLDATAPDGTFIFTPPPGVRVITP